jgi:hypothetical protein
MRTVIILLALTAAANAQTVGGCTVGNTAWAPSTEKTCSDAGGTFYPQFATFQNQGVVIGSGATVTNTPAPKCPEGYQLVLRGPGQPACARDVIDPQ